MDALLHNQGPLKHVLQQDTRERKHSCSEGILRIFQVQNASKTRSGGSLRSMQRVYLAIYLETYHILAIVKHRNKRKSYNYRCRLIARPRVCEIRKIQCRSSGCIHSWLAEILLRLLHLPADTVGLHHAGSWQNVCLDLQGAWAWCGVLDEFTTGPSW